MENLNYLKELAEKLEKLANSPYLNIFTFETPEQEAEYNAEIAEQITKESNREIGDYLRKSN